METPFDPDRADYVASIIAAAVRLDAAELRQTRTSHKAQIARKIFEHVLSASFGFGVTDIAQYIGANRCTIANDLADIAYMQNENPEAWEIGADDRRSPDDVADDARVWAEIFDHFRKVVEALDDMDQALKELLLRPATAQPKRPDAKKARRKAINPAAEAVTVHAARSAELDEVEQEIREQEESRRARAKRSEAAKAKARRMGEENAALVARLKERA